MIDKGSIIHVLYIEKSTYGDDDKQHDDVEIATLTGILCSVNSATYSALLP